jgi:hypothetical protein
VFLIANESALTLRACLFDAGVFGLDFVFTVLCFVSVLFGSGLEACLRHGW